MGALGGLVQPGRDDCFAVMRSSSEEGSYLRLVDFGITQLQAESNKEEEDRDEAAPEEWKGGCRCRANSAHIRQSRPDSGLDLSHFQGKVLIFFQIVPFSLSERYGKPLPSEKWTT